MTLHPPPLRDPVVNAGALWGTTPILPGLVTSPWETWFTLLLAVVNRALNGTIYVATLASVTTTTNETTILSFTIPANAMGNGDVIEIRQVNLEKNNKTSAGTATIKVNAGAGAQVTVKAVAAADSATEFTTFRRLVLQRVGANILVSPESATTDVVSWSADFGAAGVVSVGTSTPTNFTSDILVSLTATLSASHATFYIKPQAAQVVHWKT